MQKNSITTKFSTSTFNKIMSFQLLVWLSILRFGASNELLIDSVSI